MEICIAFETAMAANDLPAARAALGDPPDWPNSIEPYMRTTVLRVALGASTLATIQQLLDLGADPNLEPVDDGFPALIDVLHHRRDDRPELAHRWTDRNDVLRVLLAAGADVHARGLNDWTALHLAVIDDDPVAVQLLLDAGADPHAKTRIDDLESPLDIAEASAPKALEVLRRWLR
jgi:ankyrin repeat protein